jgi:hypothetical protein
VLSCPTIALCEAAGIGKEPWAIETDLPLRRGYDVDFSAKLLGKGVDNACAQPRYILTR